VMLREICDKPLIEKVRYREEYKGHIWEIDEFHGGNEGLLVAEVELKSEREVYEIPPWIGKEVSSDPRYFNSNLIEHPYSTWNK